MGIFCSKEDEDDFGKLDEMDIDFPYDDLNACCGVMLISDFEGQWSNAEVKANSKAFVRALNRLTKDCLEALAMIALNQDMTPAWAPVLTQAEFSIVSKGMNKKTGNQIFIWTKVLHKTRKTGLS